MAWRYPDVEKSAIAKSLRKRPANDYISAMAQDRHKKVLIPNRWIRFSHLNWPLIFAMYTIMALLSAGTVYTSEHAAGERISFLYPLIWEVTGHWLAFLILPFIVLAFVRWPVQKFNLWWSVPLHLIISVLLGMTHTMMMFYSRIEVYEWFDLGLYDYGFLDYRFLMEYHKQFVHYWAVYLILRVVHHYRETREKEKQAAALELRTSELQRQLTESQLQTLRGQLQPHFLFNTLNMIASLMHDDVEKADQMLVDLSAMLRWTLETTDVQRTTVEKEIRFLQLYLRIMETRFEDRLHVQVRIDESVTDAAVPAFLLQPLVENAIRHNPAGERIEVTVSVNREGDELVLRIVDNGPGMPGATSDGIGLSNTRERLHQLYGAAGRLDFSNGSDGGLTVTIRLPFETLPVEAVYDTARADR